MLFLNLVSFYDSALYVKCFERKILELRIRIFVHLLLWTKRKRFLTYFCKEGNETVLFYNFEFRQWIFPKLGLNERLVSNGFSIFLIFFMQGCQLSCQNKIYGCIFEFFMGILRTKIPFINWLWISLFNCCRRTGYLVIVTTLVSRYFLFVFNFYFDFYPPILASIPVYLNLCRIYQFLINAEDSIVIFID